MLQCVPIKAAELTLWHAGKDKGGRGAVFVCTASIAGKLKHLFTGRHTLILFKIHLNQLQLSFCALFSTQALAPSCLFYVKSWARSLHQKRLGKFKPIYICI